MSLSADTKNLLQQAHDQNIEPEAVPARNSQAMRLELGGRKVTLISAQGNATEAGKFWYRKLKENPIPDSRLYDNAKTFRKPGGRTDFVKTRSGAEVQLRTWEPSSKTFRYTALGKKFYKRRPRTYVVQIPVTIYVRRKSGGEEYYNGTYPASDMSPEIRAALEGVIGGQAAAEATIKRLSLIHI